MTTVKDYSGREVDFEAAAAYMDAEVAEQMHGEGIEDEQEFFEEYAKRHAEKFDGEEFAPFYGGAW